MHLVVFIKQVPDVTEVKIDPKTNTLQRENVPSIINPVDLNAIEEALRLKEKYGGRVTVFSMGPPQAKEVLSKAVSYGADRAVLISDKAFAGADTLATSYTLACALKKIEAEEGAVDLILCGDQAVDGDTGQVGPGIATRLSFTLLANVFKVESCDLRRREIIAHRAVDGGTEILKGGLPALITVLSDLNDVRYSSLPNLITAARYDIETWGIDKLEFDPEQIGINGSPTLVRDMYAPTKERVAEIIEEKDPYKAANLLIDMLIRDGIKIKGREWQS